MLRGPNAHVFLRLPFPVGSLLPGLHERQKEDSSGRFFHADPILLPAPHASMIRRLGAARRTYIHKRTHVPLFARRDEKRQMRARKKTSHQSDQKRH